MQRVGVDELAEAPIGRHVVGHSFVIWVDSPTLAGSAYFGRPDARDFPTLERLSRLAGHAALAHGFDVVIDCSGVEAIDMPAFSLIARHITEVSEFAPKLGRVSIVRPAGMVGAILGGLFADGVQSRFRSALFADPTEAFGWLGRPDAHDARARVDGVLAEVRGTTEVIRRLREYLAAKPRASLAAASRALGLSERSLSRRLGELHTTFRAEVQRARLRTAESMLIGSDDKLEVIARKIGFASRAHFSDFFRRITGETPSDFRARRR
jgi:AraC-like DNA-binding protein